MDFDVRDNRILTFFVLEESLLWIMGSYFSNSLKLMMDLFKLCLLKMLTDGLEWCALLVDYCDVFISCLDSHSDGTHSLQSIHCWASDAMLHFSKSDEETFIYILDKLKVSNFKQIFIFGWTIPLIDNKVSVV